MALKQRLQLERHLALKERAFLLTINTVLFCIISINFIQLYNAVLYS